MLANGTPPPVTRFMKIEPKPSDSRGRSPRVLSMCADRARDRHSDLAAVSERVAIWSQRNVSGVGMSRRISTCMTAPTISRRRTWLARNDSSVSCVGTSRSLAAMALRVSLSRSTKWRRDDEPLEPQARRAFRSSRRPGLSIESIMADDVIAARSERARLRVGAWRSRSGVPSPSRCQPKIATCSNSRPTRTA